MFGYIVPCVPELKVRELEEYRRYYCGLCRALKDRYGRTADLAYDAAFIHLLGDALIAEKTDPRKVKCAVHPAKGVMARRTPAADYAADLNILMAWAKAEDDVFDTNSAASKLHLKTMKRKEKAVEESVPRMTEETKACARAIRELEKSGCAAPDAAAEPYGKLFGSVLADLDVVQSHVLSDLGYNIGRWVYLIDAWDDMEEDEKKDQYNVYNLCLKKDGLTKDELRERAAFSLHFTLAQAADALRRLDLKKNRELLDNIVRLGLYQQTHSVLSGAGRAAGGFNESIRSTRRL